MGDNFCIFELSGSGNKVTIFNSEGKELCKKYNFQQNPDEINQDSIKIKTEQMNYHKC